MTARVACVIIAIVLAIGAAFGGSLWVFGSVQLLALAVIAVAIGLLL